MSRSEPGARPRAWTTCPGCGVQLPASETAPEPRSNASAECRQLYGEVLGNEADNLAQLGRLHQLTVDAYGSQHGGPPTPPIATAFGLIGLRLALDEGWSGTQVRSAHQYMGEASGDWPVFDRPATPGDVTVYDVAAADSPEAHADAVGRWAAAVWSAWHEAHPRVRALIDERLPTEVRGRILAD